MSYRLGVDLGTTFVAAAVTRSTLAEMVTLGDRSLVVPAAVYLGDDGQVVTGEAASRRVLSHPERVGREFKRRLGDPTPVMLGGEPQAVTELLGALLRDVLGKVTEVEGVPPERVVLTHPANWGPYRRGLFEQVPSLAGLSEVTMVSEPEAAAAHYAATRRLADGDVVAVYDLGGGTFDATVLRKRSGGVEILGVPEGIERLGGVDFDEAILAHLNVAGGGVLDELDMSDPRTSIALARLRQDCVLAKETLSVDTEATIPVYLPGRHFEVKLSRDEFETMIRAPIESTIGALARTLRSAQVSADELSAVLLVGGSSRIPLVARMVSEELKRPTLVDTHPKYAVALGAATLATPPTSVASDSTGLNRDLPNPTSQPSSPTAATSIRTLLLWVGGPALLLVGIITAAWKLVPVSSPFAAPQPAPIPNAIAPAPPTTLAPPRRISFPNQPGQKVRLSSAEPAILKLNGDSFSVLDTNTLAPRWSVALPKLTRSPSMHTLGDESVCVKTSSTECLPVNWVTRTVGPPLPLPGNVFTSLRVQGGPNVVMMNQEGILSVMDPQTRAVRSVPIPGWQPTSGLSLIGVGSHRAYVVADARAPAPVLTAVDLGTTAVTTSPWPPHTRTTGPVAATVLMDVSPDDRWLYALADRDLLVFDTANLTLQRTLPQHAMLIDSMETTSDGRYLFLLTENGELRVIEAATGKQVASGRTAERPTCMGRFNFGQQMAVCINNAFDIFDVSAFAGS